MSIFKAFLLIGLIGYMNIMLAGVKSDRKIHKHIIQVTVISQDHPLPRPVPYEESELMPALIETEQFSLN